MYNNILFSMGHNIGISLMDKDKEIIDYIDDLVKNPLFMSKVFTIDKFITINNQTDDINTRNINNIEDLESVQDVHEDSIYKYIQMLNDNGFKTMVWNGPLGNYEDKRFSNGTVCMARELLKYVEENKDVFLCIGGGDTVSATEDLNMKNDRIFISTGGGAMLEFLEKEGSLPGIKNVLY